MIPLTYQEMKSQNTFACSIVMCVGKYVSLYSTISTLLLPLTIHVIGGQYGEVMHPKLNYNSTESSRYYEDLLSLSDMSVLHKVILISLFFLVHLLGFISVINKWGIYLLFYFLFRAYETSISIDWWMSVTTNHIKSHVMSQAVLGWYCFFASFIQFMFGVVTLIVAIEVIKFKKE